MSKKRKTKQEKIKAATRHADTVTHIHQEISPVSYSVNDIKTHTSPKSTPVVLQRETTDLTKFIQQDVKKILIATVGIFSFNIVLFVLLQFSIINLGFLGY